MVGQERCYFVELSDQGGALRSITENEYSSSGLCLWISPVCPVSPLLRACDESDNGEGKEKGS